MAGGQPLGLISLPGQLREVSMMLNEASAVISALMESETAKEIGVRYMLPDELHGMCLILKDRAEQLERVLTANNPYRPGTPQARYFKMGYRGEQIGGSLSPEAYTAWRNGRDTALYRKASS